MVGSQHLRPQGATHAAATDAQGHGTNVHPTARLPDLGDIPGVSEAAAVAVAADLVATAAAAVAQEAVQVVAVMVLVTTTVVPRTSMLRRSWLTPRRRPDPSKR